MPISMGGSGSEGFPSYDPHPRSARQVDLYQTLCHYCGFEPENVIGPPESCPKCFGHSWDRFVIPGSIVDNARAQADE